MRSYKEVHDLCSYIDDYLKQTGTDELCNRWALACILRYEPGDSIKHLVDQVDFLLHWANSLKDDRAIVSISQTELADIIADVMPGMEYKCSSSVFLSSTNSEAENIADLLMSDCPDDIQEGLQLIYENGWIAGAKYTEEENNLKNNN